MLHGRGTAEIQGESGLTHGGSGGDDDHLASVQALGEFVEVGEAGGYTVELALVLLDVFEGVEDIRAHLRHGDVVGGFAPVGDGVDLGLGLVDDLVDVAARVRVAELDDARARGDESAHDGPLAHDARVVGGVRGGGHGGDEGVQVGGAAHLRQDARALEFAGDGDSVGGFRAAVEFDDGVEDRLVAGLVEVLPAQHLGDDVGGLGRQHHRSKDAHLRVDVLRRDAVELVVGHRDPLGCAGV